MEANEISVTQKKRWDINSVLGFLFLAVFLVLMFVFFTYSDKNFTTIYNFAKTTTGAGVYIFSVMTSIVLSVYFNLKAKTSIKETGAQGRGIHKLSIFILIVVGILVLSFVGLMIGLGLSGGPG